MLAGAEDGGPGPSPRSFHAAAYVPAGRGAMYLLGGLTAGGVTRDFWVLNLTTLQWRQEKVSNSPQPTPQPFCWALTETAVVAPASFTPRGNRSPGLEFPQPSWGTLLSRASPGLGHSFTQQQREARGARASQSHTSQSHTRLGQVEMPRSPLCTCQDPGWSDWPLGGHSFLSTSGRTLGD